MQSSWSFLLLVLIAAFVLTWLSAWFARQQGMLDFPGERHSHLLATPRGGGLGIVLALLLAGYLPLPGLELPDFWWHCLMPAFCGLALVGLLDDRFSLSVLPRLLVQLTASFYLLVCARHAGWTGEIWQWITLVPLLIWMTNLFNFMDGSNGMAAMQTAFAGSVLAVLFLLADDLPAALLAAAMAAAALGFLPWNLGKARVFMGDVGSISLGFLIAGLLFYGLFRGSFSIPVAIGLMLVFFCDSSLTLLARVMKGERWYTPHKQHVYQRLIAHGWSHSKVMWLYQLINLLLIVPVIVVAVSFPELAKVAVISAACTLAIAWFLAVRKFGVLA